MRVDDVASDIWPHPTGPSRQAPHWYCTWSRQNILLHPTHSRFVCVYVNAAWQGRADMARARRVIHRVLNPLFLSQMDVL